MDPIKSVRFALVFIVLVIEALKDFRKKEVNIPILGILAIAAMIMVFLGKDISVSIII